MILLADSEVGVHDAIQLLRTMSFVYPYMYLTPIEKRGSVGRIVSTLSVCVRSTFFACHTSVYIC